MKAFPTCLFAPNGAEADIERRTISGGTSLSGDEDLIETTGGGRVFVEMDDFYLDEVPTALAWRAFSAWMDGGVRPVIVPLCDGRHQPTTGIVRLTHSDGTTFSDETEYTEEETDVTLAASAALRATRLYLNISALPRDLLGGEWLSIDHPTWRWRAYRIAEIFDDGSISIRPPLREACDAGTPISFDARCVMHLVGDMRSPMSMGYAEGSPLRFIEDMSGVYE